MRRLRDAQIFRCRHPRVTRVDETFVRVRQDAGRQLEAALEAIAQVAGSAAIVLMAAHVGSAVITAVRQRRRPSTAFERSEVPAITIIRPLKGIEPFTHATLQSTFELAPAAAEILFCVESAADSVVPIVERLISAHPHISARLLIGRDVISSNPKLNNLAKGWQAASHPWIAFVDSNVLLPVDALVQLAARIGPRTGMVCSPPVGCTQYGFASRLECAFLNGLQARWQSTADALCSGFAQGKVMYFNREVIEAGGGLVALGSEAAEDAAATKLVRAKGLDVRLVDRFFEQPIGRRTIRDVWDRQLRWAMLRRASFPLHFAAEILSGGVPPVLLTLVASLAAGLPVLPMTMIVFGFWYGTEHILARLLGWPSTVTGSIVRDALTPLIWAKAWMSDDFTWHGNAMSAGRESTALNVGSAPHIEHSPGATR